MNITYKQLNSYLYNLDGSKSENYDLIMDYLNPFLNSDIQIGGNISLNIKKDITELFEDDFLKKEYLGAGLVSFFKNISGMNKFYSLYNKFIKFKNEFDKTYNELIEYETLIKNDTNYVLTNLAEYFVYYKFIISYEYLKNKDSTLSNSTIENNIKLTMEELSGKEYDLKNSYKEFSRAVDEQKKKYFFSKKKSVAGYFYLKKKINTISEKLVKFTKASNKYSALKAKYRKLNKGDKKYNEKFKNTIINFESAKLELTNNITKAEQILGNINNFRLKIVNLFNESGDLKSKSLDTLKNNLFIVYDELDNLKLYYSACNVNFKKLIDLFKRLSIKFQNKFNKKLEDNIFLKKIVSLIEKTTHAAELADVTVALLDEMKNKYMSINFPPPNIDEQINILENCNNSIVATFDTINENFKFFIVNNNIVVDENTIVSFINSINRIVGGNQIMATTSQTGGLLLSRTITEFNNKMFLLHTYDMYAIFVDFVYKERRGVNISLRGMQTFLRLYNRHIINNLQERLLINTNDPDVVKFIYPNVIPGTMMISKELDFNLSHNIIPAFVNKIKQYVNEIRPQFMGFLYQNNIYIYVVSFNQNSNINYYLYSKTSININESSPFKQRLMKIKVFNFEYYTYIPKFNENINIDINKELFILSFFIEYKEYYPKNNYEWNNFYKTSYNEECNAKYKYDKLFLPIDTLFNKVLIPYIPVKLNKYNIYQKSSNLDKLDMILGKSKETTDPKIVIFDLHLFGVDPINLLELMNLKFVMFFTNAVYVFVGPDYLLLDNDIMKDCYEYFNDYVFGYNMFFNTISNITNVINIDKQDYLGNNSNVKIVNLFGNSIKSEYLKKYYNSDNYDKYIFIFKYLFYEIQKDIDPGLINKIKGIDTAIVKTKSLNELDNYIFNILNEDAMKQIFSDYLKYFQSIVNKIKNKSFDKYINNIVKSIKVIESFNETNITLKIKEHMPFIINKVKPGDFYDKNIDTFKNSDNVINLLKQTYTYNAKISDTIPIMDALLPGIKELSATAIENKLSLLEDKKPSQLSGSIKYIDNYIPYLITEEGAKKLVNSIIDYNANKKNFTENFRDSKYLTSELTAYSNIEKVIHRLVYYINIKLNEEQKQDFRKEAYKKVYKQYDEKYTNELKLQIEESEKKKKEKKK